MHDAVHELCLKKDEEIELLSLFNSDFYSEKKNQCELEKPYMCRTDCNVFFYLKKTRTINKTNSIRKTV